MGDGIVEFIGLEPERSIRTDDGYTVTLYKVRHSVPEAGYLIENEKGRRVFDARDTGPTNSTWERLKR